MKKKKKSGRFERIMHVIFAPMARFFTRAHIIGRENIPMEGGCVVCSNHIAFGDPIVISAVFPRQRMPKYLAKAELFRIPILASLIRAFGAIPLDRHGSDVKAIRRAIETAEAGEMLTVFPQGTRQPGKNPADTPIKAGAAMIASHAGVPLLPVCIRMKKQRYSLFRRIDVIVGKPIPPEALGLHLDSPSYREATEAVFAEVCALGGFIPGGLLPGAKG